MRLPPLLRPLRHPPMALLWGGLALSSIGDQAYAIAFTWIAVEAFGPAAGWLKAVGPLVILLVLTFGGPLADRWAPLRAMLGADAIRAAALLGVVAAWSAAEPSPIALLAAVAVLGAGQAVFRPALQALIPALVTDPSTLPAANALLDATERIARLVGPAMVGALVLVLPIRHMLTIDAASFLASAAALLAIQRRASLPAPRPMLPGNMLASMLHGVRVVRRHRLLGYVLAASGLLNGAWYAVFFLILPLMVTRNGLVGPGGSGVAAYGAVISAYGCTTCSPTWSSAAARCPPGPAARSSPATCSWASASARLRLSRRSACRTPHCCRPMPPSPHSARWADRCRTSQIAVLFQTELPRPDIQSATRAFIAANQGGLLLGLLVAPALLELLALPAVVALCGAPIIAFGLVGLRRYA